MEGANFVIVHPDPAVIPDDGGCFQQLGYPIIVHRDPAASVADLVAPSTALVLFAAQLDSDLPLQICHILVSSRQSSLIPFFLWGPGCTAPILEKLWGAGAADCFSERESSNEVFLRISKQLGSGAQSGSQPNLEEIAARYNHVVRDLAHDLKNPLCILHGYAQMAQMGQGISPDEANDMLSSSREMTQMIDSSLAKVGPEFFASSPESCNGQAAQ